MDDREDRDDPVKSAFEGSVDLYDVATWDVRGRLDRLALAVYNVLHAGRSWALVFIAAILFMAQLSLAIVLVIARPVLGLLALVSVVPALGLVGYFWYDDPTRREPIEPLAVTFLLAILFATFAAVLNTAFLPPFAVLPVVGLPLFFFLVVGPVEESVKWLAVRLYAYRDDSFDTVVDGMVYGAVAGLGFAATENFAYIVSEYLRLVELGVVGFDSVSQVALARAFVGPGHVIYSAFAGYYLGLAKFNPDRRGPIVVKGLLIAASIHALYNSLVFLLPFTAVSFVAFVVFYDGVWLLVLYRKLRRYEDFYDRLTPSPGGDVSPEATVEADAGPEE
jgi:RsiW-degrading membrane proteinase PrsW (M82 family)